MNKSTKKDQEIQIYTQFNQENQKEDEGEANLHASPAFKFPKHRIFPLRLATETSESLLQLITHLLPHHNSTAPQTPPTHPPVRNLRLPNFSPHSPLAASVRASSCLLPPQTSSSFYRRSNSRKQQMIHLLPLSPPRTETPTWFQ